MAKSKEAAERQARNYFNGWAAITEMMDSGQSWSGNERNCAYLNLRDGTFVDVSALDGLDFLDDGRALAISDWNADGRLDAWLKNRSGPQLRFLQNASPAKNHWIAFKLTGKTCNRDAIGARVSIEAGGRKFVRTLLAGDGYLSQSSKWIHFGLGDADRLEGGEIFWPDGNRQLLEKLAVNRRYAVEQGGDPAAAQGERVVRLDGKPADVPKDTDATRVVLKVPLPMSPIVRKLLSDAGASGSATLINLWTHWCAPCKQELSLFAQDHEQLSGAGVKLIALNLDKPADRIEADAWFKRLFEKDQAIARLHFADDPLVSALEAVFLHVRGKKGTWPLPTSLLVDPNGSLQIIYLGPLAIDQLRQDAKTYGLNEVAAHERMQFPGRWYYRTFRNLPGLADELDKRGLFVESEFYRKLGGTLFDRR